MSKFNDYILSAYTIVKDEIEKSCIVCKENTKYIDYCLETRICSEECYVEITKLISHK